MADHSGIEWTNATWNPLAGCTPISPGCTHCYAATMARRLEAMGQVLYQGVAERRGNVDVFNGTIVLGVNTGADRIPLRWKKPRMVFVNSMSDLFHEHVPDEFIDRIFAVMALCPQHTFQVLTKRPERMAQYVANWAHERPIVAHRVARACGQMGLSQGEAAEAYARLRQGPLPNAWLGTSVEDQPRADERIPHLLCCPAAVRFLSCEPLLGPIDFDTMTTDPPNSGFALTDGLGRLDGEGPSAIHWVIAGGESGHGARPMHPDWARSLRDQCAAAGVPFFMKQWGEWAPLTRTDGRQIMPFADYDVASKLGFRHVGKKAAGRLLDGVEHNGFPTVRSAAYSLIALPLPPAQDDRGFWLAVAAGLALVVTAIVVRWLLRRTDQILYSPQLAIWQAENERQAKRLAQISDTVKASATLLGVRYGPEHKTEEIAAMLLGESQRLRKEIDQKTETLAGVQLALDAVAPEGATLARVKWACRELEKFQDESLKPSALTRVLRKMGVVERGEGEQPK